jgi:hypothetical protein
VALYQLSQVYLEQNETVSALTAIRAAKGRCEKSGPIRRSSGSGDQYRPCLWGGRCIPRDQVSIFLIFPNILGQCFVQVFWAGFHLKIIDIMDLTIFHFFYLIFFLELMALKSH